MQLARRGLLVAVSCALVVALLATALLFEGREPDARAGPPGAERAPRDVAPGEALPEKVDSGAARVAVEPSAEAPPGASGADSVSPRTTVRTRIVDERGAPVVGARLRALDPPASVTSGPDGVAELVFGPQELRSRAELTFEVACAGFASDRREAAVTSGKENWLEEWVLFPAGAVAGIVLDEDGRGVNGATVGRLADAVSWIDWQARARGEAAELVRGVHTTSEKDGSFVLESVRAGRPRLVAFAERRAAASDAFDLPPEGFVEGIEIRMGAVLPDDHIAGMVIGPDGEGLRARLTVRSKSESRMLRTDDQGRFEIDELEDRSYELLAVDPQGLLREARARGVPPGTADLVLRLSRGPEFELLVTSGEGSPIEGFAVSVVSAGDGSALASRPDDAHPGGKVLLSLPLQDFEVLVHASGWMPARLGPLTPASTPAQLVCRLEPARGLRGVVLAAGEPVAGARSALHRAVERATEHNGFPVYMEFHPACSETTDDEGAFVLPIPERDDYYLRVEAEGWAPAELGPLALAPASERTERIELGPGGALEVHVRSGTGASVAGQIVAINRGDCRARTRRSGPEGTLLFERLTPGPWQVCLVEQELRPGEEMTQEGTKEREEIPWNCQVIEGRVTAFVLWMEERGSGRCRLDGRLVLDGKPAQDWLARLEGTQAKAGEPVPLSSEGRFSLATDGPGPYRLFLTPNALEPEDALVILAPVELREGTTEWFLGLETGSLEGTIGSASEDELTFCERELGSTRIFAPLVPDEEGRFRRPRVPAGKGRIVRYDPQRPLEEQEPRVLLEVEIAVGKTTAVQIP